MPNQTPPLLSAREVARLLNIKISTVYDAVARGRLPAVKLWSGRKRSLLRFRRSDLERLLQERTTAANEKGE